MARSSVFFPFAQPSVRSPTRKIIKGRMPLMRRAMNNMMGDWDGDKVRNVMDCQPRNKKRQDIYYVNNEGVFTSESKKEHHDVWPEKIRKDYGQLNRWEKPVRLRSFSSPLSNELQVSNVLTKEQFGQAIGNKTFYNRFKQGIQKYYEREKRNALITTFNAPRQKLGMVSEFIKNDMIDDTDKDGVNDALDCDPNNPEKQGFIHNGIAYVYHGTTKENYEKIKQEGLKPKPNYWGRPFVFLTSSKKVAEKYAKNGVVLQVAVPRNELSDSDTAILNEKHPFYQIKYDKTILPSQIKLVAT